MVVARMAVASGRIGLPDFDHRVGHAAAVFIHNPAGDDDALALRRVGKCSVRSLSVSPIGLCPYTGPVSSLSVCGKQINGCRGARRCVERYAS